MEMNDEGAEGDLHAGDNLWSVSIPATVQRHRSLVRYRIRVEDGAGNALLVPYADDPQPNFAYYCYDGVPSWSGAAMRQAAVPMVVATRMIRTTGCGCRCPGCRTSFRCDW